MTYIGHPGNAALNSYCMAFAKARSIANLKEISFWFRATVEPHDLVWS